MALLADKVLARPMFADRAACRDLEAAVRGAHVFELSVIRHLGLNPS